MEPNNEEVPSAAPPVEALGKSERLLNKKDTGAQALMLLGLVPEEARTLDKEKIKDSAEKAIPLEHKEKIKKASFNERKDYWEGEKDAMVTWRKGMDAFLDVYKTNNTDQVKKDGLLFLQKILKKDGQELGDVKIDADNIYDTFMKDGEGDVEFFARRIADNKTITFDEIEKNQKLINNLGNIYGANSAKISELLTHGIANYKQDSEAFIASAQENLNQKNYGDPEIWEALDKNSGSWDEKQAKIKEAERIAAEAVVEKKKQEEEAARKKKENEKKTSVIRSLEKDKDGVEDAYNIVANQDTEKIKKEWNGHQKLTISALNEPVVIDEEVIRDYNELVAQYAIKENKEVPFFFVEDTENKRIVKIFVGEAKSYGSTELSPITAKAKDGEIFADWWNGENNKKNLFNGKDGRFKVGMGHTHPKGYGPMFSNVGEGDFGLDYSSEFEFRSSALFTVNPCASNISFVGAPDMGLISAFEAKPEGVITYHPISVSETETSTWQDVEPEIKAPEVIVKELDDAIDEYNKSDSELIKKFVPVLESLKGEHTDISEVDYQNFVERVLGGFLLASGLEDIGKEKEQLVHIIGSFDLIYARYNDLMSKNTNPRLRRYYEDQIVKFEEILKNEGVEKTESARGKKYDENIMNQAGEKEVDEEDEIGTVLNEFIPGFTYKGEPLKRSFVEVGKAKETLDKTLA